MRNKPSAFQVAGAVFICMSASTLWAAGALWVINRIFGAPPVSLPWALFGGAVFTAAVGLSHRPERR